MPNILLLPGDGIGPEVIAETQRVLEWVSDKASLNLQMETAPVGGASYDEYGTPLTDENLQKALDADAVILGAVGGPQYDNVERHLRPEAALLALRKELDLFANLRPAITYPSLASASSLKQELVAGLDILIVRELTSGVYFGTPRGMETLPDGTERCIDTQSYTKAEIERISHIAFELAKKRNNMVHSAEKSNVMETGAFWRKTVTETHQNHFSDVTLHHILADNCAMQLVREPKQFDVLVTDNLFGDLLSDVAAMLTGSLGMLPSASLGAPNENGKRRAMYEPVHGSAPDIAGQKLANPIATIASAAMMLRYSFNCGQWADKIDKAIATVLDNNIRTADIVGDTGKAVSTTQMSDAILSAL